MGMKAEARMLLMIGLLLAPACGNDGDTSDRQLDEDEENDSGAVHRSETSEGSNSSSNGSINSGNGTTTIITNGIANTVTGDGNVREETREASAVAHVVNDSALTVQVRVGEPSIKVTIDGNLQPLVNTSIGNDTLTVSLSKGINGTFRAPIVQITMPHLRSATAATSGQLDVAVHDASSPFTLAAKSSGDIVFNGEVSELTATAESTGGISLSGSADRVVLSCSGNSSILDGRFSARTGVISNSRNGRVDTVITESVDVTNSGNGSVTVRGGATPGVVSNSSRGKVVIE